MIASQLEHRHVKWSFKKPLYFAALVISVFLTLGIQDAYSAYYPRPLVQALETLEQKLHVPITYEDPPYIGGDGGLTSMRNPDQHYDVSDTDSVQSLIDRDSKIRGFTAFDVVPSSTRTLNVIPVHYLGPSGKVEIAQSILDTKVSIPPGPMSAIDWLALFCLAVSKASGETITEGDVPLNMMYQRTIATGGTQQPARIILNNAFADLPASWQLFHLPDRDAYAIDVHIVPIKTSTDQ